MKHLRGSTQAPINPLAIMLTVALYAWALVGAISLESIVTLILPLLNLYCNTFSE